MKNIGPSAILMGALKKPNRLKTTPFSKEHPNFKYFFRYVHFVRAQVRNFTTKIKIRLKTAV